VAELVRRLLAGLGPWLLTAAIAAPLAMSIRSYLGWARGDEALVWRRPLAVWLLAACVLVGWVGFHLRRQRGAAMAFTRVDLLRKVGRGLAARLMTLPAALRVVAIAALVVALARPQTYRTVTREIDTIDIMVVLDLSKSMEEMDLRRNRLDAAQRVVRRFLAKRSRDRVGLVIFAQGALLQCPLTDDMKALDEIVADLRIGDVPELGTAIGDGLGMALAHLRKAEPPPDPAAAPGAAPPRHSRIVVLLSDGDNNWVTKFEPDEAARIARDMKVKVFTVLVGAESSDFFGGATVNPATLRSIATVTGGRYFRAADVAGLEQSFDTVRETLDKTRRTVSERVPDRDLFAPIALLAAALVALELVLAATRLRRLP
jgi:Ca-activated chloride channel family protein